MLNSRKLKTIRDFTDTDALWFFEIVVVDLVEFVQMERFAESIGWHIEYVPHLGVARFRRPFRRTRWDRPDPERQEA